MSAKLTKTQQELLNAMKAGVVVHYMPYCGRMNPQAYYFRADTLKKCTSAALALRTKGLAEVYDSDWRSHKLRIKATGEDA